MMQIKKSIAYFSLCLLVGSILAIMLWPGLAQAGPTLPSRDLTPTPTRSSDEDEGGSTMPVGAYIELQTQITGAGAWSVVQWQDNANNWHDVEGWRGPLAGGNNRRWWVASKDFGKGPFRWAVVQGQNGPLLGTSAPFNLPAGANETTQIEVLLKP